MSDQAFRPDCAEVQAIAAIPGDEGNAIKVELAARSTANSAKQSPGFDPGTEKLAGEASRRAHTYEVGEYASQVLACAERKMLGLCVANTTVVINTDKV